MNGLAQKIQYMTTAARLRGYADALETEEQYKTLTHTLNKAATLLEKVWEEYEAQKQAKGEVT